MDSVLVKFHGKNYYVDYDDLLNKANDKLFAYEDEELTKNATLNGKTLMLNKKDMEDKLKKDIKMPTRMPSNLATEGIDDKQEVLNLLNSKKNEIVKNIKNDAPLDDATDDDIKQWIKDLAFEFLGAEGLTPVVPKTTTDWKAHETIYNDLVDIWAKKVFNQFFTRKKTEHIQENKMVNEKEQKLRKYIREYILEILNERGKNLFESDPYGQPDEDKYLFKTDQNYLAGIQSEAEEGDVPNAEDLAAKEKAAKERAEKSAYDRFFSQALAKFGFSGVASIPDEKKREFFDYVDTNWTSKQETPKKKVDEITQKVSLNGRTYDANVFYDDDAANDFMTKNPGWGVLKVDGKKTGNPAFDKDYRVYVANNDDMGITETSSTGGVAGYETPAAFTGQKGISKKQKRIAQQLGYELVDKSYAVKDQGDTGDLKENIDTLYLKNEKLTAEQKLGLSMRHVRNNLTEIENLVKKSIALKQENNIDTEKLGKRTYESLKRINEKVVRLMVSLNDMK